MPLPLPWDSYRPNDELLLFLKNLYSVNSGKGGELFCETLKAVAKTISHLKVAESIGKCPIGRFLGQRPPDPVCMPERFFIPTRC